MIPVAAAYLVVREQNGFGDVYPLAPGQRYILGRSTTNPIILKDDMCSREHAEVYSAEGRWRLRDLKSLNGTLINGEKLETEWELSINDELHLGRTLMVFVENISQLPDLPPPDTDNLAIKKRLGQTRFLTPIPPATSEPNAAGKPAGHHRLSEDLSRLYCLALGMGSANTISELARLVLHGLLEAVPADVGAILTISDGNELEVAEHHFREGTSRVYLKVSDFLSKEVLKTREAVLAEDVSRDVALQKRDSIREVGANSLICAPIIFEDRVVGLIHLYSTDPIKFLDSEDLEFVMAVARQLGAAMHQIRRQASLSNENRVLRDQLRVESEIIGLSNPIKTLKREIAMVAITNATALVRGESGTGKELVARAIHYSSARKDGPFVCLNCAALPESLLESELFGHEKGAFTGATEKKIGKFEAADHGTIFLDEIGEMQQTLQAKVLRVLEGHPFERVGGHIQIRADVRVVAATNQPLEQAIQAGSFRRDLFFRLQVVQINVPPLRVRNSDVVLLADYFLKRFVRETGRKIQGFKPDAVKKIEEHSWPGNVRELRNVIERAVVLGQGPMIDASDIWLSSVELATSMEPSPNVSGPPVSLEEIEKRHIRRTLEHTGWNKSQAAALLGIERSTLDRKIKLYDLRR